MRGIFSFTENSLSLRNGIHLSDQVFTLHYYKIGLITKLGTKLWDLVHIGCVRYILASLFCLSLKESIWEARKNAFYFTSKDFFVLEIIKF